MADPVVFTLPRDTLAAAHQQTMDGLELVELSIKHELARLGPACTDRQAQTRRARQRALLRIAEIRLLLEE